MRARWMALATVAMTLTSCTREPAVRDAWVRLPAVAGRPGAAYATLRGGAEDGALTAIATPAAERVELHRSMMHGDHHDMRMVPVDAVAIGRGTQVRMAPGGVHAMMFGLRAGLRAGDTIPLTFRFRNGRPADITVDALLVGAGDPAP